MIYTLPLNSKDQKVRKVIDILGCLYPFSSLANREKDVFAEYISGYIRLRDKVEKDEIFQILFGYEFTKEISTRLSTKERPVSMDIVRNYTTKLRKKGLLSEKTIDEKFLYLFDRVDDEITFKLKYKEA